jgi:hypothetical protein
MVEPHTRKPVVIGNGPDRLVRVLAANQKGDGFHALTFSETEVQGVAEIDPDHSALVMRSGAEIPVALSYKDLEQKIYSPNIRTDDSVLDLRDLTGEVAKPKIPANTNQIPAAGDRMPDGTVFAGISPDTNKPMYATPADASLTMKFNEAQEYAAKLDAHNHKDWRVPTQAELNVLFNNRAAIGGFNVTGSNPAGWYWSATPYLIWYAWGQRFSDGPQSYHYKDNLSSVRLVR